MANKNNNQQPPPPAQLNIDFAKDSNGRPTLRFTAISRSSADVLEVMRQFRKSYPQTWAQVNMEVITPDAPALQLPPGMENGHKDGVPRNRIGGG